MTQGQAARREPHVGLQPSGCSTAWQGALDLLGVGDFAQKEDVLGVTDD
jgi:hypothetical protein